MSKKIKSLAELIADMRQLNQQLGGTQEKAAEPPATLLNHLIARNQVKSTGKPVPTLLNHLIARGR